MHTLLSAVVALLRALLMPKANLALENAALRQQLAVYQRCAKQPRLHPSDRVFWAVLRIVWPDWTRRASHTNIMQHSCRKSEPHSIAGDLGPPPDRVRMPWRGWP